VWSSGIVLRFFAGSQAVEIKLEDGPASALGASGICGSVARGVCCKSCWTMPCRQRCLALWPSGFVFLLLKLCQSAISSLERLTRDSGTYMSVLDGTGVPAGEVSVRNLDQRDFVPSSLASEYDPRFFRPGIVFRVSRQSLRRSTASYVWWAR
jgi:hypothetical protein